jgi:hypothetical protein
VLFFIYKDSILRQENQPTQNTTPTVQSMQVEDKKITDSTKPFNIDIVYPSIAGLDGFNQKVKDIIDNEVSTFKKNSLDNDNAVKETDPQSYAQYPREYDLKIDYIKGQIDETTVSIMLNIYNFEGGAHGANYFVPVNYDVKNNKEILLKDLFVGQSNYLAKISAYAVKDLTKQITDKLGSTQGTWIQDGAGPKEDNFSVFLMNKNNLVFYFSQYQVAPYVAGDFEVTFPRN